MTSGYFTLFQKSFSPFTSKYIWSGPFKWHTRESPLDGFTTTWSPRTSYLTRSVAPHRYILDDLNSMDPQPISCSSPSLEAASHLPSTGFFWHAQSTSASDIKNTNGILFIPTPQYRQFLPNFAKMQLFSCENCLQKNRRFQPNFSKMQLFSCAVFRHKKSPGTSPGRHGCRAFPCCAGAGSRGTKKGPYAPFSPPRGPSAEHKRPSRPYGLRSTNADAGLPTPQPSA